MASDPFANAQNFLNDVKSSLSDADKPYLSRLHEPQNLVKGDIEVKMDDGSTQKLTAFRSQHNNALGPYKGGIRFHQDVSESEVKALALWMAIKTSIAGIPLGGGKGGVIVNPKEMSEAEVESVARAYMRLVADHIGVDKDIPAPDVNTTPQVMAWMLDEYEKLQGKHVPGVITGKPLELGGSEGRTKATGYGGFLALESLRKALKEKYPDNHEAWYHEPRAKVKIAIQGFGNVGYYFADAAMKHGYNIVAVSDSRGAIYDETGLDAHEVLAAKQEKGSVTDYPGKTLTNEELLELDVDIVVPSALENVITKENADRITAPVILELANGPVTPGADALLAKKDVIIVPDVLANSGGVIVSYLEWVQNRMGYYWQESEVDQKLEERMATAFEGVWEKYNEMNEEENATMRKATYVLAVERIIQAERLRRPEKA